MWVAVVEEVGVEGVDVLVVVPERAQRLGDLAEAVGVRLGGRRPRLAAVVGRVLRVAERVLVVLGVHQPAGPRRDVDDQGHADQRRRRPAPRRAGSSAAAAAADRRRGGRRAPEPGQQAEGGQREERRPLGAARRGRRRPRRRAATDGHHVRSRSCREAVPQPLAVGHDAVDAAEDEEGEEDVEQRQPRQHEVAGRRWRAAGRRRGRAWWSRSRGGRSGTSAAPSARR